VVYLALFIIADPIARLPPIVSLFPYSTLFRSQVGCDAENLAIELMVAGARAGDIAKKVHGFITDQGYGHTILYGPAHGCGQMERSEEHTSELQSRENLVCRLLLAKKKTQTTST